MILREIPKKIRQIELRTNWILSEGEIRAVRNYFRPCLAFISALICSHGIPACGFFCISSARRSSSAACSGVSSQSYPLSTMFVQTCCASSSRSSRLNRILISFCRVFHGNFPLGMGGAFQSWNPSMNSSQSRCASSTRSSNGSFLAATRNFHTDTVEFYSVDCPAQAGFSPTRNTDHAIRFP